MGQHRRAVQWISALCSASFISCSWPCKPVLPHRSNPLSLTVAPSLTNLQQQVWISAPQTSVALVNGFDGQMSSVAMFAREGQTCKPNKPRHFPEISAVYIDCSFTDIRMGWECLHCLPVMIHASGVLYVHVMKCLYAVICHALYYLQLINWSTSSSIPSPHCVLGDKQPLKHRQGWSSPISPRPDTCRLYLE